MEGEKRVLSGGCQGLASAWGAFILGSLRRKVRSFPACERLLELWRGRSMTASFKAVVQT